MTGRGGVDYAARPEVDNGPGPHLLHPERCPDEGHPGATYNPGLDRTWCLCGARQYPGNRIARSVDALGPAHCGGVLSECLGPDQARRPCPKATP